MFDSSTQKPKLIFRIYFDTRYYYYNGNMKLYSGLLAKTLNKWPGKKYFGIYRFLPVFFVLGAALEFSMIHWEAGNANFCTYHIIGKRHFIH